MLHLSYLQHSLLPLEDVLRIGKDIAMGLFHLHPTIVHRDLKVGRGMDPTTFSTLVKPAGGFRMACFSRPYSLLLHILDPPVCSPQPANVLLDSRGSAKISDCEPMCFVLS